MESSTGMVVCRTGFKCKNRLVRRGESFKADHPIVAGHERHFRPLEGDGIETATARPGETRDRISPLRDQQTTPPRRRGN